MFDFFGKPQWRVDRAGSQHAAAIADLHAEGFARGWSTAEIEDLLGDRAVIADILRSAAQSPSIDGFALSRIAADEAELLSIAIAARQRGKGGATPLLTRHLARVAMAGVRRVVLEVDEANAPACGLYNRFGFEQVGTRPAYYARRDGTRGTALVMARRLG
ncbi:GNAT family N-acetyltransferase [Terrihabitans sp. B22-R8]|uniref:GNAT family N-acetyltransferase n=1 Tax=Terrihabitans sp. B22-R8 TaxID=3425128 RepID=UPI00403CC253